jgi:hypothetical protein
MKKIITVIFTLLVIALATAQAPDSWTEKNGVGLNVPASTFLSVRSGAVGFSINGKGYIGTGVENLFYKNDFWEYDPITNTLTQKANFGGGTRGYATGFSIGGKGYIGTGKDGTSNKNDFWEYDPAINAWTQKTNFGGTARYSATGFHIGNKGYIGTGYDTYYKNDFWEYDPMVNSWTQKANYGIQGRISAAAFSIGNKGYIGTGLFNTTNLTDFWEYDPSANSWTQKADFGGTARFSASGLSIGNKGYLGAGKISSGNNPIDFWEYDPSVNIWAQKADFSAARFDAISFSISNKGYICTGMAFQSFQNDFWEYDPAINIWTQKINYTTNARFDGTGFSIGNKAYIGTGSNNFNYYFSDFWEFDPMTNTWTQKANFGGGIRKGAVGFNIGDKGYIGTGVGTGGYMSDFWEYNPSANTWMQKANFGGAGRYWAAGFSIGNKGYIGTGHSSIPQRFDDFWEYDQSKNIWTQKANFADARWSATGFSIGNKGYIGTGYDIGSIQNDFYEYDPSLNTWTQKANLGNIVGGTNRESAIGFSIGGKGYLGTGIAYGWSVPYKKDFFEYDPVNDVWVQRANLGGSARYSAIGFCIGSKGYVSSGNNGPFRDCWEYTPICVTPVATIFASGNVTFCNGDSVFLYANNGYNYQWKKNGVDITGGTSYFYYAKTTGSYTCYLTNSCGAVTSSSISVTVNSLPSVIITPAAPTIFCSGGSVVLNAPVAANRTYQWKKGTSLISGATLSSYTVTTGGNYRVIVTNTVTGCSKTTGSATVVTINPLPIATITPQGPTAFCSGGSVVLAANTGAGLTYKWKKGSNFISGATLSNYTATLGGTYKVEVTNSNGCSKLSAGIVVSVPCREGVPRTIGIDFTVYPNPNFGEFTIKFLNKPASPIQIELTDELGKVVKRFETDDETVVIKESNLANGIYCLTVRNKNAIIIKKINIVK